MRPTLVKQLALGLFQLTYAIQLFSNIDPPQIDALVASPLEMVPELKESFLCQPEGDQVLADAEGNYLPAYPNSPTLKGRCSFEDFEDERLIGRGAFGDVYEAVHVKTGIKVAIKELSRPVDYKHIRREECIQHSIRSPFIVKHYCTIVEDGFIAFVIELVEGYSLYKARKKYDNLPIVSIAAQIVLMIEYLHDHNILYRDLKPENIMWSRKDSSVKLIDFGLAQKLEGPNSTASGVSGTPPFMAPEMFSSRRYSYPVDWYSLGLVIYELISGRNPFDGIKETEVLQQQVAEGFECHLSDQTGCHMVSKLTALVPSDRWGVTSVTRRFIRRHQWFQGIPWEDFERGHINVLIPPPKRPHASARTSIPIYHAVNDDGVDMVDLSASPLRTTIRSSIDMVGINLYK